jgi:Co/Zn/Cd efflux system component
VVDAFRRVVLTVALLNLAYFGVEAVVAVSIGSVSLLSDSIDFLEDTSVNALIFFASVWSVRARSRVGAVLALVILVPALATVVAAVLKILAPSPPQVAPLTLAALGALAVNVGCALLLVRHRAHPGGLARATWLSARNDALANVAIIGAAGVTALTRSGWPDILVGVAIGLLNAGAAGEVWRAAKQEGAAAEQPRP